MKRDLVCSLRENEELSAFLMADMFNRSYAINPCQLLW